MTAAEPAVDMAGVAKSFSGHRALEHVDLSIPTGTVLGLLGPNGAGKTTLVRILTTLLQPDAGHASVLGHDVVTESAQVRQHIGVSGQYAAVDVNLTGFENLWMVGRLYGLGRSGAAARARELLDQFRLSDVAERAVKTYSGGMTRRLDLAGALVARPRVVVLDEPTTGLDPRSRMDTWSLVRDLVSDGAAVLLTTQYLEEADQLADSIVVLNQGRVVERGTSDELKSRAGQECLEVSADIEHLDDLKDAMTLIGDGRPVVETHLCRARVSVRDRRADVSALLKLLEERDIPVLDLSLRRPTLDDVFLELTESAQTEGPSA
ncbi:ABC-2 type transport system ATP-binding protein [Prauserella aidingensis]|uniref:ATP-binding cassette domain-containing protein n=1 Tax=Prauserella aidingensis TaxID=387890 RepID=UPI0020A3B1C6|nr:ATP-binding cassette domain-containing protein [Prauserella aidingensis]MCP2253731.1 ABC-2 type transport system ATP-binding protein [Prauserella aidingensis]